MERGRRPLLSAAASVAMRNIPREHPGCGLASDPSPSDLSRPRRPRCRVEARKLEPTRRSFALPGKQRADLGISQQVGAVQMTIADGLSEQVAVESAADEGSGDSLDPAVVPP